MTKNDYIEKITQNLEHLTKDELKDVSILTTSQLGVRLKVAEKEYWEKEVEAIKSQLQQQSLPVVPEFVGIWIKKCQELNWMITDVLAPEIWLSDFAKDTENWLKKSKENFNLLALAFITGKYQVEKPQLFYLKNKITGMYLSSDGEGLYEQHKNHGFKFTQEDINSLDTGSYEQIEVME